MKQKSVLSLGHGVFLWCIVLVLFIGIASATELNLDQPIKIATPTPTPTLLPCPAPSECLLTTEAQQKWPDGFTQVGTLACGQTTNTVQKTQQAQLNKYCYKPIESNSPEVVPVQVQLPQQVVPVQNPPQQVIPAKQVIPAQPEGPAPVPAQKNNQEKQVVNQQVVPAKLQGDQPPVPPGQSGSGISGSSGTTATTQPGLIDAIVGFFTGLFGSITGQQKNIPNPYSSMMFHMGPEHAGDYSSVSGHIKPTGGQKWVWNDTAFKVYNNPAYDRNNLRITIPVIANGVLYVGGSDNIFYALDAATGATKWKYITAGKVNARGTDPAVSDGIVYFVGDGNLYALDAGTGNKLWVQSAAPLGSTMSYYYFSYSPTVDNGTVFITYTSSLKSESGLEYYWESGGIAAFDGRTGKELWHYSQLGDTYQVGVPYSSCAVVAGEKVYVAGTSRPNLENNAGGEYLIQPTIQAFNARSGGNPIWTTPSSGDVVSCPAFEDGKLYVNDRNGTLTVYDAETGMELWKVQTGNSTLTRDYNSPVISNGVVYLVGQYTQESGQKSHLYEISALYAFDAETGNSKWTYPIWDSSVNHYSSPVIADGVVYFNSEFFNIYALDASSGKELWKLNYLEDPNDDILSSMAWTPVIYNGIIYIPTDTDYLIAVGNRHPAITGIYPYMGLRNSFLTTTIDGSDFKPGTQIHFNFKGTDLDTHTRFATNVIVQGDKKLTCTFDLTNVNDGVYPLYIRNPDGQDGDSGGLYLVVSDQTPPTVTGITPGSGYADSVVTITDLEGSGFRPDSTVTLKNVLIKYGPDATVQATNVRVLSENRISCTFDLTGMPPGDYDVIVGNFHWGANYAKLPTGFSVLPPLHSAAYVSPDNNAVGGVVVNNNQMGG